MYENMMYNPAIMPYFGMQQQQHTPSSRQEVIKVNGENGANAINLAPNSSLLALDMSGSLVWLVTTDGAGYKTVSPFDISPHEETPAPDFASLESRIEALERMMNDAKHSATVESESNYTAYTANKTDDRNNPKRK